MESNHSKSAYETLEFTRTLPCNKLVALGGFEPPRTIVFETIASASFALIHSAITLGSLCVPVWVAFASQLPTTYHTTPMLSTDFRNYFAKAFIRWSAASHPARFHCESVLSFWPVIGFRTFVLPWTFGNLISLPFSSRNINWCPWPDSNVQRIERFKCSGCSSFPNPHGRYFGKWFLSKSPLLLIWDAISHPSRILQILLQYISRISQP